MKGFLKNTYSDRASIIGLILALCTVFFYPKPLNFIWLIMTFSTKNVGFFKTSIDSLRNKNTSNAMHLNTTVWILSSQHLQGNEMQSKDQDFSKRVICRIIRLTGNRNLLWENLQVVEKFTEWNIHYLLSSGHYLSNSATKGKHFSESNNIKTKPQAYSSRHIS